MAHAPEKRALVRACYVHERQPIEVAAGKADVSDRTAMRWKADAKDEGDDWDRARAARHMAGEGLQSVAMSALEDFVTLLQSAMQSLRDNPDLPPLDKIDALARLTDAYSKMMSGMSKAFPQVSRLAVAMDVLRIERDLVAKRYPQHLAILVEILEPLAEELAKEFV